MYAATSPCEPPTTAGRAAPPLLERAEGRVRLEFRTDETNRTRVYRCFQQGSSKVRLPRTRGPMPEAVVLNTAGGMTGGDSYAIAAFAAEGAGATLTSQAAERIYRSTGADARLDVSLTLSRGARLDWLPQETIFFDGGRLTRHLDVAMAGDSRLLLCEAVILGRTAHGEAVRRGRLVDHWRIRREGRLVYADALRLDGAIAGLTRGRATLGGNRAFATLLAVMPEAERRLDDVRQVLEQSESAAGVSAWDGMLAVRIVAGDGARLRAALLTALLALDVEAPRIWSI